MRPQIIFSFSIGIILLTSNFVSSLSCNKRTLETGIICVCNSTSCDDLDIIKPTAPGEVLITSSSRNGLRFAQMTTRFNKNASCLAKNSIIINRSQKFQSIVGFGNAFTGAVSHNLDLLPKDLQYKIYENYFSKEKGIALNMMRIPIGGCDFDLHPWAYNETPEKDLNLSNFTNLDQRDLRRIEQIRELEHFTNNHDIKFVGTAWSSPPWMKTNNDWTGYGFLKEEYYQTWAEYHVKYIELMEQQGMKYWAITTGNEPLNGNFFFFFVKFMSLGWSASSQGKWISENLGPLVKEKFPNLKILTGDDQRYVIPLWLNQMFESYPESRNYIDGIAVHWYWDSLISPKALQETHELIPDKLIIASEACEGDKPWHEHFPLLGDWNRAENYITDIIEDLNNFVNSWIDWNILLDLKGGPNYVNNTVDAAIVINETSRNEFYKQPMFYALGHFSRFIPPDSVRIGFSGNWSYYLHVTAFLRPDNLTTLVCYNSADFKTQLTIVDGELGSLSAEIPPKSIHTFLFKTDD